MSHLLQLLLLLALVILVAKAAGALAIRMHQPAVLGEILAGLLFGPTLLNMPHWPMFAGDAHGGSAFASLHDLAELGVLLLMGIAGMETDLGAMRRVGKVALYAALGGVLAPVLGGIAVTMTLGPLIHTGGIDLYHALFISTVLAATSVSISAQTLIELGQLRSREGTAILGAAVIDDVVGIVLVSVVLALHAGATAEHGASNLRDVLTAALGLGQVGSMVLMAVLIVVFFVGAWVLGKLLLERTLQWAEHLPTSQPLLAIAVAVMLLYAWGAEWIGGVAFITGSYLAGLLIAQTRYKHLIEERIAALTYSVFVPAFFMDIGLNADARPLFVPFIDMLRAAAPNWGPFIYTAAICVVAVLAKVIGCGAGAVRGGFTRQEALRVGV
ncbi:MAG TPA: cation:proton antiporter, partial [bacterium]|nr:cation:proton antiporter [bacterium]